MDKGLKIAGGVLLGATVVGTGGLVLAPVIGGMVGSIFLGWWGCVATSSGLALLGGGSIASGGLGMAGGTALITRVGAVSGGVAVGGVVAKKVK